MRSVGTHYVASPLSFIFGGIWKISGLKKSPGMNTGLNFENCSCALGRI